MVTILPFGKVESSEVAILESLRKDLDKLSVGLQQFGGVLEKDRFIAKLITGIALIDNITAAKTTLESMKTTLQSA